MKLHLNILIVLLLGMASTGYGAVPPPQQAGPPPQQSMPPQQGGQQGGGGANNVSITPNSGTISIAEMINDISSATTGPNWTRSTQAQPGGGSA